jgi:hypothetical protein
MDDLATYLLDIVQNSIQAKASMIQLSVVEEDELKIKVIDNGIGMSDTVLAQVTSPFYTTRTTRRVGLGLPLIKMLCEQTDGDFRLESTEGLGTSLYLMMHHHHIDMPPIGNLGEMIYTISIHQDVSEFIFTYESRQNKYTYQLSEIKRIFGQTLTTYSIMQGLIDHINQEIELRRGGL